MIAASAAASMSASSITTSGPLPPISSSCALPAARRAMCRPVAVEPMKPTADDVRVADELVADLGAGAGDEVEHARREVGLGDALGQQPEQTAVLGAGVHTTVLPPASAGATISAGIVYGQFHGVTTATGPSGRRTSRTRLPGSMLGAIAPSRRMPSSAAPRHIATSSSTSS